MAITSEFTCPKGHSFKAVAKLRARCPQCGLMARRDFSSQSLKDTKKVTPQKSTGILRPLKSSSSTLSKVGSKKTSVDGSKPVLTLKKEEPSSEETKPIKNSTQSALVIRRGQMPKPKPIVKPKTVVKTVVKTKAPLARRKVTRGVPSVGKMPRGSRERKVAQVTGEDNAPFWVQAKRKYFRA